MTRAWRQVLREDRLQEIVDELEAEIEEAWDELEAIKEEGNPDGIDIEAEERKLEIRSQNVHEEAEDILYEQEAYL